MENMCIAGIVTFNPDLDRLQQNVKRVIDQVYKVLIIDNGSDNEKYICETVKRYSCVSFLPNGQNKGIAYAMNQIGDMAVEMGSQFFMTLDQDSVADEGMVAKLLELFSDSKVGGVSPFINVRGNFEPRNTVEEFKTAISSGFIVRTSLWQEIGGFWDFLFIDEVDHEFCLQIVKKGYRILRRNDTSLDHYLGESSKKIVFGHEFRPTNHSAFRRYYIARNNVIMDWLYPEDTGAFAHRTRMLFRIIISILICEEDKCEKIKAVFKGIRDGRIWCSENLRIEKRRMV